MSRRIVALAFSVLAMGFGTLANVVVAQKSDPAETFVANAQVITKTGTAAVMMRVVFDRYTPEADRNAMLEALKHGGYSSFLAALRQAPAVGTVEVGDQTATIRWASQRITDKKRRVIVAVTDRPILFIGGARPDAKAREGYELALVQLDVDDIGFGQGSMAAAARVKPGGETGVQVDDYSEQPIKLVTVRRLVK